MIHGGYCRREGGKVLYPGLAHPQSEVKTVVTFCQDG
jgi:hypothetical protein